MLRKSRYWLALVLLHACIPAIVRDQDAHLLRRVADHQSQPMLNSMIWGKTSFEDITLDLHYGTRVRPSSLIVGRGHPNGIRIWASFPGYAVALPLNFDDTFEAFNQFGELDSGYYIQVAEHDFDRDGIPEIIIAAGDGVVHLLIQIVKYHAPESDKDAGRQENWSLVGSFLGQREAFIEGDTLTLPYGGLGLFAEYTWVKTKFVQTE